MFHYVRGDSVGKPHMVDDERNAEFRDITGFTQSNMVGALLTWGGRQIPLEYADVQRTDAASGSKYALLGFNQFGASKKVQKILGIGHYTFTTPEEHHEARMLAVEALLAYCYKAATAESNLEAIRLISEGHEWKISDFGYHFPTTPKGSN